MKPIYQFLRLRILFAGSLSLVLASCGSYEYASYEDDGIYSSEAHEAYANNDYSTSYEDAEYYEQLFAEQSAMVEEIQDDVIFTDIDSYSSAGSYDEATYQDQQGLNYSGSYAGWGDQTSGVSINIYQDPFPYYYSPYMTPYYGGFYDPYWGYGYGYGYGWNNIGWNFGYGYYNPWRWNSWRWNAGLAYNPYAPYWYGRYNNHKPYYYYGSNRNVAYNTGRRSSYSDYNSSDNRSSYSTRRSRISDYSNSRGVRARAVRSNRSYSDDDRSYSRTTRVESPNSVRSNRTYRSSTERSTPTRARARTTRRSRSNTPTVRRSTSRSSNVRSAPTRSTRSSGTRTSRSSRGRGN